MTRQILSRSATRMRQPCRSVSFNIKLRLQLASTAPQIYDLPNIRIEQMLNTLGIKNVDKLVPLLMT